MNIFQKISNTKAKPQKLQTRFFMLYLFMAGFIMVPFSLFFYYYVSNLIIDREKTSISDLTNTFSAQTDSVLEDMDSASININYSSLIKSLLPESYLTLSMSNLKAFTDLCVSANGTEMKVDQINLYDYYGNVIQVGLYTKLSHIDLTDVSWIEQTRETGGRKIISLPYEASKLISSSTGSGWYISLYRSCTNSHGVNVGAIETVKHCKSIFKHIINYQKCSDLPPSVYVYNELGNQVYPYGFKEDSYHYFSLTDSSSQGELSFTNPVSGKKELAAFVKSKYSGWCYMVVQEEHTVLQPLYRLLTIFWIFLAIMLAACILISIYHSHILIRPINELKNEIKNTEVATLGNQNSSRLPSSFEELEEVNQAFHTMRLHLKDSMNALIEARQQEIKSRTMALQSQINPHFYYNSLASAIVLAENGQTEDVVNLCRSLTKIMRYITATTTPVVSISEELDYIGKYLYCMKVRYQSSLNYMIDIDNDLLNEKIPKLVIQPLVENAIKYGTDKTPPWGIAIHGKLYNDHWQIDVMDSGKGFSEEALALIQERIQKAVSNIGLPDMQIEGMGLLNVYLRWKLYCEDSMIFEFGNTPEGHGIVTIGRKLTGKDQ